MSAICEHSATSSCRAGSPNPAANGATATTFGFTTARARVAKIIARQFVTLSAVGAALILSSCSSTYYPPIDDGVRTGPFYVPVNVAAELTMPAEIRRVLVLPIFAGTVTTPETARTLDEVVRASLQRQQRFEVVALSREDCQRRFGAEAFSSAAALPTDFLAQLAARHAVDAVMFVDLTAYQPYQPQTLGLRAKLAHVRDVRLVWSVDEIVSAADAAVRNSARRNYFWREHGARLFDLSPAALQSPGWFAAFVADELFATLPPR